MADVKDGRLKRKTWRQLWRGHRGRAWATLSLATSGIYVGVEWFRVSDGRGFAVYLAPLILMVGWFDTKEQS